MEEQLCLHLKEYAVKCRANVSEMQKVWLDLEVSESARQVELGEAMAQACHAWSSALGRCTQHRTEVAAQISALLDQTVIIADELGEANNLDPRVRQVLTLHSSQLQMMAVVVAAPSAAISCLQEEGVGSTIVARRQGAEKQLAEWKERRSARLTQAEELQVCSMLHVSERLHL